MMSLINQILLFFGSYTPLVSFLGAIIGGEETLILLSILSSNGYLTAWVVLLFFYLGILVSDTIWFFLGKSKLFDWFVKRKIISRVYLRWDKLLTKATKGSSFHALFITKFLYGFRIPTIMYLGREKVKVKSFLFDSAIIDFIWTLVVFAIGWFAGKGILLATDLSKNIVLYLLLVGITFIIFTIIVRILSGLIKKWLIKK